jgi:RimJ/RimL family protein N-acetyltransferase
MRNLPAGLAIQPTRPEDLPDLGALWADGEVMRWVGYPAGLRFDEDELERWLATIDASPDRQHFAVHQDELGFCGELFYAVDRRSSRAALDVKLVPRAQGCGIASAAFSWLIETVFEAEPGVEAVWTDPQPENTRAQRLYARCGLRPKERPRELGPGPSYWELVRGEQPGG